ncbi:MAG TPA: hypothetical protein VK871_10565 [Candidatus Limnocylindrales bacterium]|nr:hypothetical protein [Candidatus Limnocylindrales bacterium]
MNTTPAPTRPTRLTPLDIVTARFATAHGDGAHVSPILGCYVCLHGVRVAAPAARKLEAAA